MTVDEHANRLIERIGVLRHPCDLDLLIFFARHPRSLLPSEHLAIAVGYGLKEVAASLDLLVDAQLVTRTQTQRHAARMYVFAADAPDRGWFPDLMKMASTRDGRLAMVFALRRRSSEGTGGPKEHSESDRPAAPARHPFLVKGGRTTSRRRRTG